MSHHVTKAISVSDYSKGSTSYKISTNFYWVSTISKEVEQIKLYYYTEI
jgi:hypothetical protein